MLIFRNFVNLLVSYLTHYFGESPQPLESMKKLFLKRLDPLLHKKLTIRPWIENIHKKESSLLREAVTFNKAHPGMLLLVKFMFVRLADWRRGTLPVGRIWSLLTDCCEFEVKLSNLLLFFKVVERFHNPVDSASNYLRKFASTEHKQFLTRAKSVVHMSVRVSEFFLILFLFISEKLRDSQKRRKMAVDYSFYFLVEKMKVKCFGLTREKRVVQKVLRKTLLGTVFRAAR